MTAPSVPSRILVEAAVETLDGALAAERCGADRIELCADLEVGGTTPSLSLVAEVRARVRVPVHVMVRPREGDFVYSDEELVLMAKEISAIRWLNPAGIVTGVLDSKNRIAASALERLMELALELPATFHRAFDQVSDKSSALDQLVEFGVARILTSGGASTAADGAETIAALVQQGSDRITIMAGGGVRAHNVRELIERTGVREIHARFEDAEKMGSLVNAVRHLRV
jgi:copper homeostasis protein CutC